LIDDVIVVVASVFALGSTVIISTAVDSGLGKKKCLLDDDDDLEQIQLKLFITTILFVLTISISKSSVLLFLYHLADSTLRRACVVTTSVLVLLWTIAVLAVMVFQCEQPTPWMIWTGECIPLVSPIVIP
jgi:hypothetical protein